MFDILEQEASKPFKIKGIAMIKNSLSVNGRFYSDKLVESIVNNVRSVIETNGSYPLTMMADHPTITSNRTLSTVGKITDMYLEGDNAVIEAVIANTSIGKDVQELIKGQFVEGLSIRASKGKFKKRNINGKLVNDVMEMDLKGVDLVVNPGVNGAKVTDIIESEENPGLFVSIEEEENLDNILEGKEDTSVKLIEAKLSDLKELRPDLVESLKQEYKTVFESEFKVSELKESVDTLNTEKGDLETKLQESEGKIKTLEDSEKELKNKLEESENKLKEIEESEKRAKLDAHIAEKLGGLKFADSVKDKIKEKLTVLESTEDIDNVIESEVQFLEMVIKESTGVEISGKGKTGENLNENNNDDDDFIKLVESM